MNADRSELHARRWIAVAVISFVAAAVILPFFGPSPLDLSNPLAPAGA